MRLLGLYTGSRECRPLRSRIGLFGGLSLVLLLAGCAAEQRQLSQVLGGAGGAGVGALIGNQLGGTTGAVIGGIAGGAAGFWLGGEFNDLLSEEDQATAQVAAQEATVSGQTQRWSNPETGASGTATVTGTSSSAEQTQVAVLKDRVETVPPLDLIGEPFRVRSQANVRGGPGTDYKVVDSLAGGSTVTVIGSVQGEPWYMIGQGGAASGFVSQSLLQRAPAAAPASLGRPAGPVETVTVAAERECRTVEQTVVLANGDEATETIRACQGPNGWEVVNA